MTQKKLVLDLVNELPDETSLAEIVDRIEFLAAIQKGIGQFDHGKGIPHEEVKRQLATWLVPGRAGCLSRSATRPARKRSAECPLAPGHAPP